MGWVGAFSTFTWKFDRASVRIAILALQSGFGHEDQSIIQPVIEECRLVPVSDCGDSVTPKSQGKYPSSGSLLFRPAANTSAQSCASHPFNPHASVNPILHAACCALTADLLGARGSATACLLTHSRDAMCC